MRFFSNNCSHRQLFRFFNRRFDELSTDELVSTIEVEAVDDAAPALVLCLHDADEIDQTWTRFHESRSLMEQPVEPHPVNSVAAWIKSQRSLNAEHDLTFDTPDLPFVPIRDNRPLVVRSPQASGCAIGN